MRWNCRRQLASSGWAVSWPTPPALKPSPISRQKQMLEGQCRGPVSGTSVRHALTSRGAMRPEFESLSARRGRGECRVPVAPAASCAVCWWHTSVVTTVAPEHPAFPHAMVLTAYSVLSPATNSSCHRHRRIKGNVRARSGRPHLRQLDTSNGCQDHTALPSASAPFVCALLIAHRPKPTLRSRPRARRCRVHRIPHQRP